MSIRMSYGLQLALALVGGACLDLPNHECTHDTTHMMVGLHHHPDLLPLQGQLTAATSRQNRSSNRRGFLNRPSNRRGLSLDSYIGRLSLKGTWKGILEVSAFLVYYITILCSSTSQITRTSQQVWRVRKEPAPRAIRFRKSRVETTIRERAGSSQEGRKLPWCKTERGSPTIS